MNRYDNDFVYGRDLVKKLMIGALVSCVVSLVLQQQSALQMAFVLLTVIIFITTIVCMAKYCRCPHCGKVIFFGVLAVTQCPRCKHSLITGKKMKKSK